jgi:uncharacterized protein DUF6460
LQPYWGKLTVRNDRGDRGNVGIIRSPIRASILPDLAAIGLDPWNIVDSVRRLIWHLWNMGFDAVRWLWQYFLLGAVIVLPIWLLVRLARAPRGG